MYREHPPSPALRPYIACYWTLSVADGTPQRILPDGCIDLIFDLVRARPRVVGAMTTASVARADRFDALGVRFRPGEAASVLGVGALALTDRSIPLDGMWGSFAGELSERIAEAPTLVERLRILDRALGERVGTRWADWRIRRAIGLLESGRVTVAEVAREVGLGERQLERLFADRVGLGPKRFARVMRLQRVLAPLTAEADLTTIALVGGFSDASHVVREIRALCGITPASLAAERMSDPSNRSPAPADTAPGRGERWSAR